MPEGSSSDWDNLLEEFRGFGGRAENVVQRQGPFGLGLFPIDPSQPLLLEVPKRLLVPADNVDLRDGQAVIVDDSSFPVGYADWFRRYQANYSWGADGETSVSRFATGLRDLPETVVKLLQDFRLYSRAEPDPTTDPRRQLLTKFLQSRCLGREGRLLVMPLVELANHSATAGNWQTGADGAVGVQGRFDGEVLVKYSNADPLRRLMRYGFNCFEPMGFSLYLRLQHRGQPVEVQGGGGRTWFNPPSISRREGRLLIQQPLLGHCNRPRLPKTLFLEACRGLKGVQGAELFEQIHQANTLKLVTLLRALAEIQSETAEQLRRGCLDQLIALSHHIGHQPALLTADEGKSALEPSLP